jgi:formyltetrahydrofolate deformylase
MTDTRDFVLTLTCPDRPGIVHAVSGFLVDHGGNIAESQQFGDSLEQRFFMRVRFTVAAGTTVDQLRGAFAATAARFAMHAEIRQARAPYRTLVLVSKFSHCLNDLLYRWRSGELQIEPVAVVSNHRDCEALTASYGVPFEHVPVTPETKPESEAAILDLVDRLDVDLVVLARYMQILSDDTCRRLEGRAINIHHSFLPSFKGAKPYHQAFEHGVKLVGATAHYVTADLDEGPIIEQDVTRVDHRFDATELVTAGRDVEAHVLSRAVRWHTESRVLLNGNRTVVFR